MRGFAGTFNTSGWNTKMSLTNPESLSLPRLIVTQVSSYFDRKVLERLCRVFPMRSFAKVFLFHTSRNTSSSFVSWKVNVSFHFAFDDPSAKAAAARSGRRLAKTVSSKDSLAARGNQSGNMVTYSCEPWFCKSSSQL